MDDSVPHRATSGSGLFSRVSSPLGSHRRCTPRRSRDTAASRAASAPRSGRAASAARARGRGTRGRRSRRRAAAGEEGATTRDPDRWYPLLSIEISIVEGGSGEVEYDLGGRVTSSPMVPLLSIEISIVEGGGRREGAQLNNGTVALDRDIYCRGRKEGKASARVLART